MYNSSNYLHMITSEPEYFTKFTMIITANLPENQLLPLAELCWKNKTPLLITKAYGLIGTVRLQLRDHDIIESRSDSDRFDLRIADPFDELLQYSDSIHMETLTSIEHCHIPYIVILLKAIQHWRAEHEGHNPSTFAEKEAFKAQIKAMSRNFNHEVNFQEAVKESYRAYGVKALPDEAMEVLVAQRGEDAVLDKDSRHFSFLIRALDLFLTESGGAIPLSGQIPDLTCTTELYVQLQQVYHHTAGQDLKAFKGILGRLLEVSFVI
jgi:amyloid beta precursor protein binding protein 1